MPSDLYRSLSTHVAKNRRRQAGYSREAVLLSSVLLLLGLFAVTAFASRMYRKSVHMLADQWSARGESAFQSGSYPAAVTDFRNALIYSPNNTALQFRLAQALSAAGHGEQAEAYLMSLLSESPSSGPVNLELARIASRRPSDVTAALRYYHGAIYGVWDQDPLIMRWEVSRELCDYLLDRSAVRVAEPELIALADNIPPNDLARTKQAGELLIRSMLWNRALATFQSVLAAEDRGATADREALAGAGTAAFHLAEYPQTVDYLSKLPIEDRSDSQNDMLETSRRVLALDPFLDALSTSSRAAIASRDLELAQSHAQNCATHAGQSPVQKQPVQQQPVEQEPVQKTSAASAPQPDLPALLAQTDSMKSAWSQRMLAANPSRVNDAMALTFQLENAVAAACGPLAGPDRALWLLGLTRDASAPPPANPSLTSGASR